MNIVYRINYRDELTACGGDWERFASENGSPAVFPDSVIGRPLWDFIADTTTCGLYKQLVNRVRGGEVIRFQLRCDGPHSERTLNMEMTPLPDGGVEFRTRVVAEHARSQDPTWAVPVTTRAGLLRMCGWCGRVDVAGQWAEVEDAIRQMELFERRSLPGLTHGICDDCMAEQLDGM